ncbi:MAG: hypothetical protein JST04_02330 [Bdellovibrionales bacterium]|nr:hypothetical protein [Bdellovibrionales bacterium]
MTSPFFRSLVAGLTSLALFAGCATNPTAEAGRDIASKKPLTAEQLKKLEELGVAILNLSVVSNRVVRDADVANELVTALHDIGGPGEARKGRGFSVSMVAVLGIAGYLGALRLSAASGGSVNMGALATALGKFTPYVVISALAVGGALAASESTGSSSGGGPIRALNRNSAKNEKDAKLKESMQTFNEETQAIADRYSRIFSLEPSAEGVLLTQIRARVVEEGKIHSERDLEIDVPLVMQKAHLISDSEYESFRRTVDVLQKDSRTEAAVDEITDAKKFDGNVSVAKQVLVEYAAWLTDVKKELEGRPENKRDAAAIETVSNAINRANRLNRRL